MQIHLKQPEIQQALIQHLATQGIQTSGKNVDIVFTAGRKGSGLSAEISIEDGNALPDFGDDTPPEAPEGPPEIAVKAAKLSVVPPPEPAPKEDQPVATPEEAPVENVEGVARAKAATSLFN